MKTSRCVIIGNFILAAILAAPGWAETINNNGNIPEIGTVNYVEGQASINGQTLSPRSVGTVQLEKGQFLITRSGRVEILLTPGVFLRVNDNSSLSMISSSLVPTEVQLNRGRAMVEVNYIRKENSIRVDEDGASTQLMKKGLYDFDADHGQIRVFKGRALVYENDRKVNIYQRNEVTLNTGGKLKSKGFKTAKYEDDFYDWSRLRSGYILEANAELASENEPGWYGPGWYWDPWLDGWAFPFDWGLGFYSPFFGYGAPFYYGYGAPYFYGYGRGYGPRRFGPHSFSGHVFAGHGFAGRGFSGQRFGGGGFGGVHGGGFHGGGGFHR